VLSFIVLSIYISLHKKELIQKTITEISAVTNGTVTLSDLSVSFFKNFPYLSIELKDLRITDSLIQQHNHPFFFAEKIFTRINPFALLLAKISLNKLEIDNGGFYLYTSKNGYSNAYLLQGKKTAAKPASNQTLKNIFDRVQLKNLSVTIEDQSRDKLFDFVVNHLEAKTKTTDTALIFQLKESILVKSVAFKRSNGTYAANQLLEGNYSVAYLPGKKTLLYDNIGIRISGQPFRFSGSFIFGNIQEFILRVSSDNLSVALAKKLLTGPLAKAISIVTVEKPLDVTASIIGSLDGGDPLVHVTWVTKNNAVITPLLNFTDCSFKGFYTNEVIPGKERNDSNSKVEVHQFSGKWQGLLMTASDIIISNLTNPTIRCNLKSAFPLNQLNSILQSDAISLTAGTGLLDLTYTGPFDHITTDNASVTGSLVVANGNIHFRGPEANLADCRAGIRFLNEDIIVDSLLGRLSDNPIKMWGTAKNTLTLLGDSKAAVSLSWNAYAPVLNIDHISSLLSRTAITKKAVQEPSKNSLAKTARQLDDLLSSGNISVSVQADKLVYHRFEGTQLTAGLLIKGNSFTLQKASLVHGKGNMTVSAKVTEEATGLFKMSSDIHMKNVDARKVWYGFDNFGFKEIGYKNIEGVLSANAAITVNLNKAGTFDMQSMAGDADFSIKNGALLNFDPVMKIQAFMFKNRDFSNIRFAEIKDKLHFSKGSIQIERMEINSTVLSLYVNGVYGLTGKTDISIQVPLSNLKKRNKDFKAENYGGESRGGMSVFLRAKTDDDGTIKIKYDPFKRFRKKI
jgi:hypothetical protein